MNLIFLKELLGILKFIPLSNVGKSIVAFINFASERYVRTSIMMAELTKRIYFHKYAKGQACPNSNS